MASAVQPDALAYEGPRQMRDAVRRAASSTHLLPLLEQSMQAPIKDMKQAQELLSPAQLNRWRQGLKAAGLLCGPARSKDDMRFFAGGYLIYSDVLAGTVLGNMHASEEYQYRYLHTFSIVIFAHRSSIMFISEVPLW